MIVRLPWPPSVNHYWHKSRLGGFHISAAGQAFRRDVFYTVRGYGLPADWPSGRLSVAISAFPPDRRARDLDNILKALLDALHHGGAIRDDADIDRLVVERGEADPEKQGYVVVNVCSLDTEPAIRLAPEAK